MTAQPIAIKSTGLVTSVGLSAPASCAAIRAKVSNPTETRFMGSDGAWLMAHQVPLEQPWRGRTKLAKMAAMAIAECLDLIPRESWPTIPLLLCVAERERPGRLDGLDDQLLLDIESEFGIRFAVGSAVIPHGRVSAVIALAEARQLVYDGQARYVVIAATDSQLTWPTLCAYEEADRLLTTNNSNGFMPGEAGGAALVGRPSGTAELLCTGIGLGVEKATIQSGAPLRADGLVPAIQHALAEAGCAMHDIDYRITDLSGEQYYFKEAALALSRILRKRKEEFEIWHPAEAIGETGAAAGIAVLAVVETAAHKGYAPGATVLGHAANDNGQRVCAVFSWRK
jgi:3-oxoacyl-[acyl-carrier-protein] synthase I